MKSDLTEIYKSMSFLRDQYFEFAQKNSNSIIDWNWLMATDKCLKDLKEDLNLIGRKNHGLRVNQDGKQNI